MLDTQAYIILLIRFVDIFYGYDSQIPVIAEVSERYAGLGFDAKFSNCRFVGVQCDGYTEEVSVR